MAFNDEEIARVVHETNRAYCRILGDFSQEPWENAPQWQRDSAVAGVAAIRANPATTPRESHEGWLRHKEADGWTYGPIKDVGAKTHPCFVPYDELPAEQRVKDSLFGGVVRALLAVAATEAVAE